MSVSITETASDLGYNIDNRILLYRRERRLRDNTPVAALSALTDEELGALIRLYVKLNVWLGSVVGAS